MPLPELIEIVPLEKPAPSEITVPGSKSITNRALILAALAGGETTLRGALWSEDTQVMVEGLRAVGFEVEVAEDARRSVAAGFEVLDHLHDVLDAVIRLPDQRRPEQPEHQGAVPRDRAGPTTSDAG